MRNRGYILNAADFNTCRLQSTNSRFTACARSFDKYISGTHSLIDGCSRCLFCCHANGVLLREPLNPSPPADAQAMVLPLESVIVTIVLLNVERICAAPDSTCFLSFLFALLFTVAILSLLQHYFFVAVFLPAIVFFGPLRVRAFVFVRCPRVGSPSR